MTLREAQRIADDCFRGHGDRYSQADLRKAQARLLDNGQPISAEIVSFWIED